MTTLPIKDAAGRLAGASASAGEARGRRPLEGEGEIALCFRQLAENILAFLWMSTADLSRILYASPGYESIWGRRSQALYENAGDWIEAIPPDDRGRVEQAFFSRAASGGFQETFRILRPDGSTRRVWARCFPVRDAEGAVCRIAGIAEDITGRSHNAEDEVRRSHLELELRVQQRTEELKRANATLESGIANREWIQRRLTAFAEQEQRQNRLLRIQNTQLAQSNKELDDFAYLVSHDLKEPLRGIHNYASFLIEDYGDKLDEDGRSKLETLGRLTTRMEKLINTILYYSQVGRVELAMEDTDLNEVLREVMAGLRISLDERGVRIRIPRPLPTARCDRVRVGEIFLNLISNASKYNDKTDKWVEVGFRNEPRPKEPVAEGAEAAGPSGLLLYVKDNGIGIREQHFQSIFRLFKRLHGRDKFGGGAGAGLTIVRKIVERHGGRVWVESTPGEGTTFYFTLSKGEAEIERPAQSGNPDGGGQP